MLQGLWGKLFIVVTVLLVISIILGGSLWHQLNTTKMQLNDTQAQLDATNRQLNDTQAQLNTIQPEMDSLKAEQGRMLSDYANLKKQIDLRLGIGQDSQGFITPDDPIISAKVQEITEGYSEETDEFWRDYKRLFQWVVKNIEYSLDSPTPLLPESIGGTLEWVNDFWRLPVETIRDETGDCEDIAVLLTSMLLNYNQRKFDVWIIGIRTFGSVPKGHVAVAIPIENRRLTILDPASRYYTPFLTMGGVIGSLEVTPAIDDWLARLNEEMRDAQIYVVFSEDFYQEFSTTEEFIDWMYRL